MRAYAYSAGGAGITDVAKPVPTGTQVLVKVRACGLNRADLGMAKGHAHGSAGGVGAVLGMLMPASRGRRSKAVAAEEAAAK